MPTTTPNFGWSVPVSTDLVKDGATAIELLGDSIDASLVDLKGGTTGQVLAKASGTDMDFSWVAQDDSNAIQNAIVDAKGDLISATAADTPARLAVGTNGHVLTADSTEATGIKWAAPAGGGKVLQVVSTAPTNLFTTTSSSMVDVTSYSLAITPTSATSKILVMMNFGNGIFKASAPYAVSYFQILRGATAIYGSGSSQLNAWSFSSGTYGLELVSRAELTYLDSPATTSSTTYKLQVAVDSGDTCAIRPTGSIVLMEIGA
jgi:hypothetical protein